ncbi:hypothetical protein MMC25_005914 [Agyrium rufum]|nr:hypothetical protein [Agyrium rufum]
MCRRNHWVSSLCPGKCELAKSQLFRCKRQSADNGCREDKVIKEYPIICDGHSNSSAGRVKDSKEFQEYMRKVNDEDELYWEQLRESHLKDWHELMDHGSVSLVRPR